MNIISNIPGTPDEINFELPFTFEIEGERFEIKMLSLYDYLMIDKEIHISIYALLFYRGNIDRELAKQLGVNANTFEKSKTLAYIISTLINLDPKRLTKILKDHNKKYWYNPKRWCVNFTQYLINNISLDDTIKLSSYFMRYCSEKKNELSQILQKGIGNVTKDQNQLQSVSTDKEWKPGYRSLGQELLDMPEQ